MIITGIEIVRDNHHPPTQVSHSIGVLPGEPVQLTYGQHLHVGVSFDYRGPATPVTLYGAIGVRGVSGVGIVIFDEKVVGEAEISIPDSRQNFVPVNASVDIPITADIAPGEKYDLYVKIKEYPGVGMPEVDDVITITGIPPTFELLEETIYPYAYIYDGPCTTGTLTFKTDPFTPANWIAGKLAAYCENEARKQGCRVMEMRVYVDKTPLLWTDWRIEIKGVSPSTTAGTAIPLGAIPLWVGILLIILALIGLIVVATWAWKQIAATFKRNPALKDVKPGWKKETLIMTIQDAEEYWERTPTPLETLEAMSEEELREYLDKIAEEEVKPPVEGLGLAIAAAGVLGLGALAVMAMSMRKE